MTEILYAPNREQVVTTNVWAFLHWLHATRGVDLADWAALQRWSADEPDAFRAAVGAFAELFPRHGRVKPGRDAGTAELLLHADVRPDDSLLVSGPWIAGGSVQIAPKDLLPSAAEYRATMLVAPAAALAEAAFQRARRPDLGALRTIVATGGPMSPEARRRIYTWVKHDVMLLARTGDTFWGNPLEPVLAQPPATPAFLTPRPSAPVTG